jgi:hypothetical protein
MRISVRRAGAVAGLLALAAVAPFGGAATAAPSKAKSPSKAMADAAHGAAGGGGGLTVVAEGLDNPRGIGFGPDGALYVAESGSGGAGPCVEGGPEGGRTCFGRSGAVTRITKRSQHRVLTGLPSLAEEGGFAATGPVDLGFSGWTGDLLLGNFGGPEERAQFGPGARRLGTLLKVNLHGIRKVADFARFEAANDPDESAGTVPGGEPGINSNPNGLLVREHSQLVADAGGNDLLKVDHKGRISVVAMFPPRVIPAPPFPGPAARDPDAGRADLGRQGPGRRLPRRPAHRLPVPAGRGQRVPGRARPGPHRLRRRLHQHHRHRLRQEGPPVRARDLQRGAAQRPRGPAPHRPAGPGRQGRQPEGAGQRGPGRPGGFVLGHHHAYISNNSILPDAGQVVKVRL